MPRALHTCAEPNFVEPFPCFTCFDPNNNNARKRATKGKVPGKKYLKKTTIAKVLNLIKKAMHAGVLRQTINFVWPKTNLFPIYHTSQHSKTCVK